MVIYVSSFDMTLHEPA